MAKMKKDELETLLSRQQNNAIGALNGTIGKHRADLLDRYYAEPYGDEVQDRSKLVDTSVRDTIESIKPELMDIFTGGDEVVMFSPVGDEDVDAAEQETEVCNHIFLQKNDGFMILYSWFTDALLLKNGYVKRYWDERKYIEIEEYDDLSPEEATSLVEELEQTSDEVEFLERSGGVDEETGDVEPLYLKIRRTKTEKRYTIENVPPEEVFVSPQWNRLDFKHCPFVAHKRPIKVSDLIEMGFDRKQVEELPDHDARTDSEEAENRFTGEFFSESDLDTNPDMSMREVLVFENYIRCDYDGDGIAELLQVFTGGSEGEVLKRNGKPAIEQVSDTPFEALCPLPIPHKHFGLSVAELVQDLQRMKTVLTRQLLDNTVLSNNPDLYVDDDMATETTYQDLAITQPGRVIRGRGPGAVQPLPVQNTGQASLMAIEYVDGLREARTGVTRYNQGMDADSLNKTATGIKNIMSAAQKKILLIARIFAETGVKSLFVNMHRDLRNGPMKEIAIRLNGEFIAVNPRTWKHRTDMTVNVGLGTGDRDIQFQRLAMILEQQKEGLQAGFTTYEHIHHTLRKMVELSGFKDVAAFFPEPKQVEEMMQQASQQEQGPDPAMMMLQIEQMKVQGQMQSAQMKNQVDAMKVQMDRMKIDNDRLKTLMQDDRERDLAAAKIEADEAARKDMAVNGPALTKGDR